MRDQAAAPIVGRIAAGALVAAAAVLAFLPPPTASELRAAAFFTSFGLLASALRYQTSGRTTGSIGFLPFLSAAALAPNIGAVLTVLVASAGAELLHRRSALKSVFNVAQQVFAQCLAIGVYLMLGGRSLTNSEVTPLAFIGMCAVFMTVNKLAVSTVVSITTGESLRRHWFVSMRSALVYDLLALPLVLFFVFAYTEFGPVWAASLAVPMLGLRQLYKSNFELEKVNRDLLQLMVSAIEARDPYTSGHSQRVSRYALVIARAAGIKRKRADRIALAALLHDVGKIHEEFAPILRNPGSLSQEEFEVMKTHAEKGAFLISRLAQFSDLVEDVRSHHEAWNGTGYPRGVSGQSIPLGARVIALADTIDAMTSTRPYRSAMSPHEVFEEIKAMSGVQFDPELCGHLLSEQPWSQLKAELARSQGEIGGDDAFRESWVRHTAELPIVLRA